MRASWSVMVVGVAFLLACGGAGGPGAPAAPTYGSVAFTKFEAGGTRLRFKTDTAVEKTWRNMSGDAVQGTYTHNGDQIEITWDPKHTNHGAREVKLKQLGDCSLAEYWWKDADGVVHDDDSDIYERKEPKCTK